MTAMHTPSRARPILTVISPVVSSETLAFECRDGTGCTGAARRSIPYIAAIRGARSVTCRFTHDE
jgi:hypothetical protein